MQQRVVRHLLAIQVGLFVISMVLSAMVFLPLSLVTQGFSSQCLLFSDIALTWNNNNTVSVDLKHTHYGTAQDCELPTFIAVSVCVACIIFSWFYICNIFFWADEAKQASSRVQLPALLIFISLFISTIVAASKISAGFRVWCHNIVDNVPDGTQKKLRCSDFENLEWTNSINGYKFYTRYVMAEVSCWIMCVSLFVLCCVTCIGCYQMLQASNNLTASQATLSVTLEESEDGVLVVKNGKGLKKGKTEWPDVESSGQDYFTSMEDQTQSSEETDEKREAKRLMTEATVHSTAAGGIDNKFASSNDFSTPDSFLESEKIASGVINTTSDDEVLSVPNSLHGSRSDLQASEYFGSEDFTDRGRGNEKDALAKTYSGSGGYGAVYSSR